MKQEKLIKLDPAQIDKLKIELANLTINYLTLEAQKRAADEELNAELKAIWGRMEEINIQIKEG